VGSLPRHNTSNGHTEHNNLENLQFRFGI
jgi:hypothetical protein